MLSVGGDSMKGNFRGSGNPMAIICRSRESRGTRCSSGVENFSKAVYSSSEYNLKLFFYLNKPRLYNLLSFKNI